MLGNLQAELAARAQLGDFSWLDIGPLHRCMEYQRSWPDVGNRHCCVLVRLVGEATHGAFFGAVLRRLGVRMAPFLPHEVQQLRDKRSM